MAYAQIDSLLFSDPDYVRLSRDADYVYLKLRHCLLHRTEGVALLPALGAQLHASFCHDMTLPDIEAALDELEAGGWLQRDRTGAVWVVNALKFHTQRTKAMTLKGILGRLAVLPRGPVRAAFEAYYAPYLAGDLAWVPDARVEGSEAEAPVAPVEPSTPKAGKRAKRDQPLPFVKPAPSWTARVGDATKAKLGGTVHFGRLGKALSPLVKEHGEDAVVAAYERYLAEADPKFWGFERFAATYGAYTGAAPSGTDPGLDHIRKLQALARAEGLA